MSKPNQKLLLNQRHLTLAILQAVQMWSDERYQRFLCCRNSDLDAEWFKWFLGEWNVARTIRAGKSETVRNYLNDDFRKAIKGKTDGNLIDAATLQIKKFGGSAKSNNKQPAMPASLVSKISFFLRPSVFVPVDRYSRIGLNQLLLDSGNAKLKDNDKSYIEYLKAFNAHYKVIKDQIDNSLSVKWVSTLATKLDCPKEALKTKALARKVFDNYLMHSGGYLKNKLKQN